MRPERKKRPLPAELHPRPRARPAPAVAAGEKPLAGRVAVVAGATRGTGRGIARALGEAGAVVYCTGRSVRGSPSPYGRPETIEETAELVSALGGTAVAVRVDHTVEAEVEALFARVEREQGRLDVLADSVAGEDPLLAPWTRAWETDLDVAPTVMRQVVLSRLITAKHAARRMRGRKRGLVVEVTAGDSLIGGAGGNILHELVKSAHKALVCLLAEELRSSRVTVLAVTPGYLRSEAMLEHWKVDETNWREAGRRDPNFLESESPLFVGRAVAALAGDADVFARTGNVTSSWELGREYGFMDHDGRRPDFGRHLTEKIVPETKWWRETLERHEQLLECMLARTRGYLSRTAATS